MKTLTLTRFAQTPFGIFGRYILPTGAQRYTLEPFNCIPTDVYLCKPDRYNKGGYDASEVQHVPGRTEILHHRGNTIDDTRGCILHGHSLGVVHGKWALINSTIAFSSFMKVYGDDNFLLDIRQVMI